MKRIIIFCFVAFIVLCSSFNIAFGEEYTAYKFIAYDIIKEDFLNLIKNPKAEDIEKSGDYKEFFSDVIEGIRTIPPYYGPHYNQYIDHKLVKTYEDSFLNATRVLQQLFDFCNEYDKVEEVFADNNIECKVLKVVPFGCNEFLSYSIEIPLTLFINTDVGDYFLTLNEFPSENLSKIMKNDDYKYLLNLYTPEEYRNALQLYDGTIYVNEVKLEDDLIKFQANDCYIPLRSTLEALGCIVTWNSETNSVTITKGENSIVAILEPDYHLEVDEYILEFTHCYYEMENDRTIISRVELLWIRYALGFPLRVIYDKDNHIMKLWNLDKNGEIKAVTES